MSRPTILINAFSLLIIMETLWIVAQHTWKKDLNIFTYRGEIGKVGFTKMIDGGKSPKFLLWTFWLK